MKFVILKNSSGKFYIKYKTKWYRWLVEHGELDYDFELYIKVKYFNTLEDAEKEVIRMTESFKDDEIIKIISK